MQQTFIQLEIREIKLLTTGLMQLVPVVINNVLYLRLEIKRLYVRIVMNAYLGKKYELSVLNTFSWVAFC